MVGLYIVGVVGVGAKEVGLVTRNGQRLGIANCVENHIQGIATDITKCANTCGFILNKSGAVRRGNTATATATGLNVVDLAENAALADLLDHLHVRIHSGLVTDGEDLAACLLCFDNFNSLIKSYGEGLFEKYVYACVEAVDSGLCVLTVVGANRNCIEVEALVLKHFLVRSVVGLNTFNAKLFKELLCLAGNKVSTRNDIYVGLLQIRSDVRLCDPTGTNDTYAHSSVGVNYLFFLIVLEIIQSHC